MERAVDLFVYFVTTVTNAAMALAYPALAFLLLAVVVKRGRLIGDIRRAFGQSTLNINLIVFNALFVAPLVAAGSVGLSLLTKEYGIRIFTDAQWAVLPLPLVVFLAVFIGDFTGYWRHRLEHTPILWPSHAVHHSDDAMTWLTLERFHPINNLTTFVIDNSVLLLLGFPAEALVANNLVRHYYGYFIHADLPWTYGWLGRVFVSPAMHRWHHAAHPDYFQSNFATVFSVFDQAFGTHKVPGPCTAPLGITSKVEATLLGQLTYMLRPKAYESIRSGRSTLFRWGKAGSQTGVEE